MGMYKWDDLLKRWERETLAIEKAVGQLLTWGKLVAERLHKLKVRISNLERRLSAVEKHFKE